MRLRSFWAATALLLVLLPALAFAGTAYVVIWGAGIGYDNRVETRAVTSRGTLYYQAVAENDGTMPVAWDLFCTNVVGVQQYLLHVDEGFVPVSVAVDGFDNAYVAMQPTSTTTGPWVVKVSPAGQVLWRREVPPPTGMTSDYESRLAVTKSGLVFLLGGAWNDSSVLALVTRLSPSNGDALWTFSTGSSYPLDTRLACGADGHPVFAGAQTAGVTLIKLDLNSGVRMWGRTQSQGSRVNLGDLAVDGSNNVLACARFRNTSTGPTDWWTFKTSSSGVLSWSRTLGGTADDNARFVRVTSNGTVYVGGTTVPAGHTRSTPAVARYTSGGTLSFFSALPVGATARSVTDMEVDSLGGAFMLGSADNTLSALLLARFTSAGAVDWETTYDPTPGAGGWLSPKGLEILPDAVNGDDRPITGGTDVTSVDTWWHFYAWGPP